ncbi:unnamed protein product [Moneuplotes crassus]|uniref:Uncharacterized protein n=1 Tax=Euplotes crassus TaxID=5936 RepID=A0AAD1Y618_EUPCR|nr:unnamed protein product [Moneuplotes crassus]
MLSSKFLFKTSKFLTTNTVRTFAASSANLGTGDVINLIDSVRTDEDSSKAVQTIDEYFRLNFRKLSFDQACTLLKEVHNVGDLEDSFWVWETLEEAIRPRIMDIPYDQAMQIHQYFVYFGNFSKYLETDFYDIEHANVKLF